MTTCRRISESPDSIKRSGQDATACSICSSSIRRLIGARVRSVNGLSGALIVELEDNVDCGLHVDRLVVEHVRPVTPELHRIHGSFTQNLRATHCLQTLNGSGLANRSFQHDSAADVAVFGEPGINRFDLAEEHALGNA